MFEKQRDWFCLKLIKRGKQGDSVTVQEKKQTRKRKRKHYRYEKKNFKNEEEQILPSFTTTSVRPLTISSPTSHPAAIFTTILAKLRPSFTLTLMPPTLDTVTHPTLRRVVWYPCRRRRRSGSRRSMGWRRRWRRMWLWRMRIPK